MPDFLPGDAEAAAAYAKLNGQRQRPVDEELTFGQRKILADAGITEDYAAPTVKCPHPDGSHEAEQWWRREWEKAVAWAKVRGDLEAEDTDALPVKLPPFPVHVLPEPMRSLVRTIAANKCVPADLPAMLALSCIGLVAGPRLVIDRGADWRETLTEWTLTILESGERKSPAFEVFQEILREVEQYLASVHADEIGDQVAEIEALIAAKTKPKSDGDEKGDAKARAKQAKQAQDDAAGEVKELAKEIEALQEQPPPRLLVGGSSTTEAIETAMANNNGHIGIMDDEGGAFGAVSGVYSNGVPTGLDSILKGYSGTWIPANERITRQAKSIPRAILGYGLTAQSAPVVGSFRVPQLRDRGFHSRWCFAVPEAVPELLDPPPINYDAVHEFADRLSRLAIALPVINPASNPRRADWPALVLSEIARKLHQEIQSEFIKRKQPDTGDLSFMSDWANKFAGRVLRHAGLLHIAAGYGVETDVSEETMRAAIEIGRWAIPHAAEVYRRAPKLKSGKNREDDALALLARSKVERWITKTRRPFFSTRDVHNTVRRHSWCTSADQVQDALNSLAEDWVVRKVTRVDAVGRQLPGAPYWVPHPDLVYGK